MYVMYIGSVYLLLLVVELGFFGLSKVTKSQTCVWKMYKFRSTSKKTGSKPVRGLTSI